MYAVRSLTGEIGGRDEVIPETSKMTHNGHGGRSFAVMHNGLGIVFGLWRHEATEILYPHACHRAKAIISL